MATEIAGQDGPEVLRAEMNENGLYEIESLCMNCRDNGMTRILPIKIPYFKEILLESFSCDHCGFKNNTVKSAGEIQERASKYTFKIENAEDFQRQIVRSDNGVFRIEDIDLEMPPGPGQFTTLESMVSKILTDLSYDQPTRKEKQPELYNALVAVIQKLESMLEGKSFPITVTVDDVTGNSFIAPSSTDKGSKYVRHDYLRSHGQNVQLGLVAEDDGDAPAERDVMEDVDIVDGEVYEIPAECPACSQPCTVNMKKVNIPYFKDVIVMATVCTHCGYKTNDIKTGGEIPEKGKKITLRIENETDLSRDILKSETCALYSEDLGLEVQPGTLGGRFTTVEGLLAQVRDQLHGQIFDVGDADLAAGDSMTSETKTRWQTFFDKLDRALKAEVHFTISLVDPLANSFVQKNTDGDTPDPQITIEEYERTEEEMEDLGLNDMKLEGYEEGSDAEKKEESNGIKREAEAETAAEVEADIETTTATETQAEAKEATK